tara:strand:+ start:854 stop:1735 length:882 start_codon:yes stop_codon:yes gene_type:complete
MPVNTNNTNTSPQETQDRVKKQMLSKTKKAVNKTNKVLKKLSVEYVNINDLKPNDYNPNRQSDHDFELLLKSMEEDGFTQPIVALDDLTIVDGEHRWRAANTLGYEQVPVVKTSMTVEQMKIATLRHNRARGSEDIELTAQVLRDLEELGAIEWAQDSLMLDDTELNRLLDDIPAPDAFMDEEFAEAWEPSDTDDEEKVITSPDSRVTQGSQGEEINTAMTVQAIEKQREQEKKLAEAKTEEDRKKLAMESKFYRLSLIFSGDESDIVKEALGKQPAVRLVEWCKRHLEEQSE